MNNHESSLPEQWVEKIFATMRATYGAAFDRQWECPPGVDPVVHGQQLKGHWGRELRGYQQNPDAIRFALDHLPAHPPNLVEFRELCNRRPTYVHAPRLEAPKSKADPERLAKIVGALNRTNFRDPKASARELRDRELNHGGVLASGKRMTMAQRDFWRQALSYELNGA